LSPEKKRKRTKQKGTRPAPLGPRGLGLGFPRTSVNLGQLRFHQTNIWVKDDTGLCTLGALEQMQDTTRPRIWGTKTRLWEATEAWPGGRGRGPAAGGCTSTAGPLRWRPPPAVPAGLTLALQLLGPLSPCTFRSCSRLLVEWARSQARLWKTLEVGGVQNPGSNPGIEDKSRFIVRLPGGPLAGNLPLRKAWRLPALRWAGLALRSAPPGASMRCVSQLNPAGFQMRAKACARSTRLLGSCTQ
jgi:hypothetical protein